jgi:putative Mg2+ transporter-C (MgtC) family protein
VGGAQELELLAVAFVLSSVIGFEREIRQRSAGLKTHTLVGVGAALFTLAGRFGFDGSVGSVDASRVAAQVVVGIGFIGGGVVFVRRDGVKGLTTAATIWLTAAIGLATGAGVVALAVGATAIHLIVTLVYAPLTRRLPASRITLTSVEVSYHDGLGVLRDVLTATTNLGYVISNVEVTRSDEQRDIVAVSLEAEGKRSRDELVDNIQRLTGVVDVRSMDRSE